MALLPEVKTHYGKLKILIDGEWINSQSTEIQQDMNPATAEAIAEFPSATKKEALAAAEAAHRAFQSWRNVPMRERARMLFDMRAVFEKNFDKLTRILSQDHGRTIGEATG